MTLFSFQCVFIGPPEAGSCHLIATWHCCHCFEHRHLLAKRIKIFSYESLKPSCQNQLNWCQIWQVTRRLSTIYNVFAGEGNNEERERKRERWICIFSFLVSVKSNNHWNLVMLTDCITISSGDFYTIDQSW